MAAAVSLTKTLLQSRLPVPGLVLQNNGGDNLSVSSDGNFTFSTAVPSAGNYNVTVLNQPATPNQTCTVTNGSGNVTNQNITSVSITCTTNTYTIGGSVSGLTGSGLVLQNNAGDDLAIASDGSFTFFTPILSDSTFDVTILTQPSAPDQICAVDNGSGMVTQNITSVTITCTNTYTIGGGVTGLSGSGLILQNNAGNNLSIDADGDFSFSAALLADSSYDVTVLSQPTNPSQTCEVSNGSGTATQDINSIVVTCTTNTYTVGGTVTGLIGSGLILQNNSGDDLAISGNGEFTFVSALDSGSNYHVTINTHPSSPSQTCVVIEGSGDVIDQNIASVVISCSTFQVGVTVTGLESGETITLQNNGTDDLLITGNGGPFVFNTLIHDLLPYNVTISAQPGTSTQQCLVVNGSGTISSADVVDISVVCPNVTALYPNNGANWNDYVNNNGSNGFAADDSICNGSGNYYSSCLHGGEMRLVTLDGVTSCSGISAEDDLNAFNWICDDSTGSVRIISTSLRDGAALSVLLDFSSSQWKDNTVTINKSGNPWAKTPTTAWWSNVVTTANSGGSLNSQSVIYLVTQDPSANYNIDADKVGLVIQPGLEITGGGGSSSISSNGYSYIWLEGNINASNNYNGVLLDNVAFSVMHRIQVFGSEFGGAGGIALRNCDNNRLYNIRVGNAAEHGFVLNASFSNVVSKLVTANSGNAGIYLVDSYYNNLNSILSVNNDNASNADGGGALFIGSGNNNVINATIIHNKLSGFTLANSPNNLLMNIIGANNHTSFYIINNSNNNTAVNLVAANNSRHGIYLNNVSNNYFTGVLKIGANENIDCRVDVILNAPGLVSPNCTDTGIDGSSIYSGQLSDAVLETNVSTTVSFVGKLMLDDSANGSDINGTATETEITDWLSFENVYRSWGLDGDPYPAINNKGPLPSCDDYGAANETDCINNSGIWRTDGRIWDWRLAVGDTGDNGNAVLHEVLGLPSADDIIDHTWSDASSTSFLKHAVEILGDAIGNDNGLCESDEACIFTPNIGAYQGEGNLISAGPFIDSISNGLTGVILYQYETNGN